MSKRTKEAERYFAETLRNTTFTPKVETDYTRLCETKKAIAVLSAVGLSIPIALIIMLFCEILRTF